MHFEMSSAICFSLDQSKILSSVNGLNQRAEIPDTLIKTRLSQTFDLHCPIGRL